MDLNLIPTPSSASLDERKRKRELSDSGAHIHVHDDGDATTDLLGETEKDTYGLSSSSSSSSSSSNSSGSSKINTEKDRFDGFMERVTGRSPLLREESYKLRCFYKQIFLEIQSTDTKANEDEVKALPLSLKSVKDKMIAALGLCNNACATSVVLSTQPPHGVSSKSGQNPDTTLGNNSDSDSKSGVSEERSKNDVLGRQQKKQQRIREMKERGEDHPIQNWDLASIVDDEAALLVSKAMEIFILELGVRSSVRIDGLVGKELQLQTVKGIVDTIDPFDFLTLIPSIHSTS